MGKKLSILKYGLLAAVVLGTAGAAGHFAARHYQATLAIVQQRQAAKQAARQEAQEARVQREKKAKPAQSADATAISMWLAPGCGTMATPTIGTPFIFM